MTGVTDFRWPKKARKALRIGFVGVGRIGVSHAAVVANHPAVKSLVFGDVDPVRARAAASDLGADSVDQADDLLNAGIDALIVATATDSHAEWILKGAQARIPVFCEKPVALSMEVTRDVAAAAKASGVPVQIGFQRRFDQGYVAAREALASGKLGELRRLHAITGDPAPPHASYIPTSGGIYKDCLVHDFDAIRWVTGLEFVNIMAFGANRGASFFAESDDVDETTCIAMLSDGSLLTLHGSRYNGAGYDVRLELAGTRGTMVVGLDNQAALTSAEHGVEFPSGTPHPTFWERFNDAYRAEINAFISVVRDGGSSPCSVEDALEALYVADAATISQREGRTVSLLEVRA